MLNAVAGWAQAAADKAGSARQAALFGQRMRTRRKAGPLQTCYADLVNSASGQLDAARQQPCGRDGECAVLPPAQARAHLAA